MSDMLKQFGHCLILVESGLPWQDHGEEQQEIPIISGEDGEQKKSLGWRIEALASQVCWHVPTESQVFYPIFVRCPQTKIVPSLNS